MTTPAWVDRLGPPVAFAPGECLTCSVGYCDELGSGCYLVLTRRWLGLGPAMFPVELPWSFRRAYHAVPVDRITAVEFVRQGPVEGNLVRVRLDLPGLPPVLTLQVDLYPHRWVDGFRRLGIPATGAGELGLHTGRGLLANYGWGLWLAGYAAAAAVAVGATALLRPAHALAVAGVSFALLPVASVLTALVGQCRRARGRGHATRESAAEALRKLRSPATEGR